MKKMMIIAMLGLSALTLAACGEKKSDSTTENSSQSAKTAYPLTINNYKKVVGNSSTGDASWPETTQTFKQAPKKVVANTRPMAELLLHLGLEKSIAGVGAVFVAE